MKYEDKNKYNREFAIRSAIKSVVGTIIMIVILIYLGNILLPINLTYYFWDYYWVVGIYILYSAYRNYNSFKLHLDDSGHIQNIKEYYRFPIAEFKESIARIEAFKLIIDKKIDILKFYTPIPILLYSFGVYVDDKAFLKKSSTILTFTFNFKDALIYGGFATIVIYSILLFRLLERHKQLSIRVSRYNAELFFYEELLLSKEKTRRLEYSDTIHSLTH